MTAQEKLVKELDRCGWVYTIKEVLLWVSLTSVKDTDPRFAGISKGKNEYGYCLEQKLEELKFEYKQTHTNFKGRIYWVQVPGSFLQTKEPENGITVEFRADGSFLRGTYWGARSLFVPSRQGYSGESLKEIMERVALYSPEKKRAEIKARVESAQKELDEFLVKKAEYEAKVAEARATIAEILSAEDTGNMSGWIDALLSCNYLEYTFSPGYQGTLEEYQKKLDEARG